LAHEEFVRVTALAALPPGAKQACEVAGRAVILCHTKEGIFAVDNICTHAYARMSDGRLKGTRLMCPLHGGVFDVRTGDAIGGPAVRPLATHAVRIVGDSVEVAVDLKAAQLRNPL
jgi:nitrite reductase/ring-hydroxylating ferredoxin subunit